MTNSLHCPMIHGGLNLYLKEKSGNVHFNQCCLSTKSTVKLDKNLWDHPVLLELRANNNANKWDRDCWECERLENSGRRSFRQAMTDAFGKVDNLSGPKRIDLLFDRSCNIACVTCGPHSSSTWQKYIRDNHIPIENNFVNTTTINKVYETLDKMDLSNMEMVQYCGGETLLGNTYWKVTEYLANKLPNAKKNLTLAFQTNGTQTIDAKYYDLIEKFHLVKFVISLDCTQERFNYLRWPANWNQVVDNISSLKEKLPVNVMFFVQETTSNLSLYYYNEVKSWMNKNFNANRVTDPIEYSTQLAMHPFLNVNNITNEYYEYMQSTDIKGIFVNNWRENKENIRLFLTEMENFDRFRDLNWKKTFPEVANFYSKYL